MPRNVIIVSFLPFPFQFSPKATMLVLAGIVVLHITTIILLLVATIDNVSESIQRLCARKISQPFKHQETNITDVPSMFWATWMDIFRLPTCPWWPRKALNVCHIAGCSDWFSSVSQAWWISDTLSTDLWGRWELLNSVWHYTNLKNYPEGKFLLRLLHATISDANLYNDPKWPELSAALPLKPDIILGLLSCLMDTALRVGSLFCCRLSPGNPGYLSTGMCLRHPGLVRVCGSVVHPA